MVINCDFFVTGSVNNKEMIVKVCNIIKSNHMSYNCILINNENYEKDDYILSLSDSNFFNSNLKCIKESRFFLLILPGDIASFTLAGIAYGLGKKCYAIGDVDNYSSYNIFDNVFLSENEFVGFLDKI